MNKEIILQSNNQESTLNLKPKSFIEEFFTVPNPYFGKGDEIFLSTYSLLVIYYRETKLTSDQCLIISILFILAMSAYLSTFTIKTLNTLCVIIIFNRIFAKDKKEDNTEKFDSKTLYR